MKYSREKNELWGYASENPKTTTRVKTDPPPRPHPPPHRHHPQRQLTTSSVGLERDGSSMSLRPQVSTPPPPYSPMADANSSVLDCESETSLSGSECDTTGYTRTTDLSSSSGYSYANAGATMCGDDFERSNENSSCSISTSPLSKNSRNSPKCRAAANSPPTTSLLDHLKHITRKCCGFSNSTNQNASSNNNTIQYEKKYFDSLMNALQGSQILSLLEAVKSRYDPVHSKPMMKGRSPPCAASAHQTNCILVPRGPIHGQEPYVIACHLFLWRGLKNSSQLKRLPACTTAGDTRYVCCNPLHWCRILEPETPPPSYTSQRMDLPEGLSFQNYGNSTSIGSTDTDGSIRKPNSILCDRITESFTTDGLDSRRSPNWCQVAYWELGERVGERYPAVSPVINIFSDNACGTVEGMYLKDLFAKRRTTVSENVLKTRQKIGLGVTLSQENDGVWLHNRATVPIFVYSPTLVGSSRRVCRLEPGDCLRAFDKYRAQNLSHSGQDRGIQTGPIDNFTMRISFGKGWGETYTRTDVTCCHCWLEVLFQPQR